MEIFIGDLYLVQKNSDEIFSAELYFPEKKLKKGYAYIKDDVVYPYRGKLKGTADPSEPGIYKVQGQYIFHEPSQHEIDEIYSTSHLVEFDTDAIIQKIAEHSENFEQPEIIINNNSDIYKPNITEEDDFLKVIVKKIILSKQINLRDYKSKFPNEYALNNMKSGLNRSTKMTVPNFTAWCEILGVNWDITIYDNGTDKVNPMKNDIELSSTDF